MTVLADGSNPVHEMAEQLAKLGVSIIPIASGTKEPDPGFRWGEFATRIADMSERFDWFIEHEHNLAAVAGPVSGNLVILDFDGPGDGGYAAYAKLHPAIEALPRVRTGSGKVHVWLRTAKPVAKYAVSLPGGGRVEVRAGTHYTLCPPSLHPNGNHYWWEVPPWGGIPITELASLGFPARPERKADAGTPRTEGEPLTEADADAVYDAVLPHYIPDHRHDLCLSLAGWLANLDVPEADARGLVERLAADHGDDKRAREYSRAVRDTYAKVRQGVAVAGWARLTDAANPLVPPAAAKRLDLVLRSRIPSVTLSAKAVKHLKPVTMEEPTMLFPDDFSDLITLAELQHKHFDPLRWMVAGILPEGATLLAGKPKSKKSWLALGVSLAIAMNLKAMGSLAVVPGRVLYLDLEGKQQRIKERTTAILGIRQIDWPENFDVATDWPNGEAGLLRLRLYLDRHPDTHLVVVDLFSDLRGPTDVKANMYEADRAISKALNQLAEEFHCAFLLVHHTRKMKADDVFDEISGTTGLQGGVSTMWVLSRMSDGQHTQLSLRGRDLIDDEPLALGWDGYNCHHVIEGRAEDFNQSLDRRAILDVLGDDEPRTPRQLAEALGKTASAIGMLLLSLVRDAKVDKVGYGKYAIVREKAD